MFEPEKWCASAMSTIIPTQSLGRSESEELNRRIEALEARVQELSHPAQASSGVALMFHSCDLDRVLAGMTLATGAASMGEPARLFFAFWAISRAEAS